MILIGLLILIYVIVDESLIESLIDTSSFVLIVNEIFLLISLTPSLIDSPNRGYGSE